MTTIFERSIGNNPPGTRVNFSTSVGKMTISFDKVPRYFETRSQDVIKTVKFDEAFNQKCLPHIYNLGDPASYEDNKVRIIMAFNYIKQEHKLYGSVSLYMKSDKAFKIRTFHGDAEIDYNSNWSYFAACNDGGHPSVEFLNPDSFPGIEEAINLSFNNLVQNVKVSELTRLFD